MSFKTAKNKYMSFKTIKKQIYKFQNSRNKYEQQK